LAYLLLGWLAFFAPFLVGGKFSSLESLESEIRFMRSEPLYGAVILGVVLGTSYLFMFRLRTLRARQPERPEADGE